MNEAELKDRTKKFALRVLRVAEQLTKDFKTEVLGRQLVRSGTSVGANYRSACRGRSKADFISKMGIVLEEADEVMYWLELLMESGSIQQSLCAEIYEEANQLVAIAVSSVKSARGIV